MNITVYLGANEGNDPEFRSAVAALGKWIGESGNAHKNTGMAGCS